MTFRSGGRTARSAAVIDRREFDASPREEQDIRTQRLVLTVAGTIAFSGLAFLAYHYTAPFADPPSYAVTASATAATRSVPVVVEDGSSTPAQTPKPEIAAVQAPAEAAAGAGPAEQAGAAHVAEPVPSQPHSAPAAQPAAPVVEASAPQATDVPDIDDPRWGPQPTAAGVAPALAPASGNELAYASEKPALAALRQTAADDPTDETETAAIPQPRPAIETLKPEATAASGRAPASKVTIAKAVNMRARGAKGARVLGVIPRGATVGLVDCDSWCEVIYDGRRGFIYKSFIESAPRAAEASEPAQQRKPSKPKVVPVQQGSQPAETLLGPD